MPFYANPAFWLYLGPWLPYALLAVVYGFGSPWYRENIGRALYLTVLSILAVLTNVLLILIFGHYPGVEVVRIVLLGGVTGCAFYLLGVVLHIQRDKRNHTNPRRRSTDL